MRFALAGFAGGFVLSVSTHKFHEPKGVGALYVRRGPGRQPWVRGGPQERDRRGGTENVPGIVGMGVAAELAGQAAGGGDGDGGAWRHCAMMFEREDCASAMPDSHVNGDAAHRLPNTTNIGFAGVEAEAILLLLSEQDVCVRVRGQRVRARAWSRAMCCGERCGCRSGWRMGRFGLV